MRKIVLLLPIFAFFLFEAGGQTVSPDVVKSKFLTTQAAFWSTLHAQYKAVIDDSLVDKWRNESINLYSLSQYDQAHQLIDVCLFLSAALRNNDLNGKCLLAKAEIFYQQEDYAKSAEFAKKAGATLLLTKDKYQLARSKNRLGLALYKQGKNDLAAVQFEEAIALKKQLLAAEPGNKTYAESLYGSLDDYSDLLYTAGKYDKEITINKEALALTKKYDFKSWEAYMYFSLGWTNYRAKKLPTEAIPFFELGVRTYVERKDTSFILYNYEDLIKCREEVKDSVGAKADASRALVFAVAMKDKTRASEFIGVFITRYKVDDNQDALAPFYAAKEKLNPESIVTIKNEYAEYLKEMTHHDLAVQKYTEILSLPVDEEVKADAHWNIAIALEGNKEYKKEIEHFREAEKHYAKSEDRHIQIVLLSNIALTWRNMEDSVNAYKVHQEAIDVFKKYSDSTDPDYVYRKAQETYEHFESHSRLLECLLARYAIFNSAGNASKAGEMANLIGKHYEEEMKNYKKADEYYHLSLDQYSKVNDQPNVASAHLDIAYNLAEHLVDYHGSIDNYSKSALIYGQLADTVNWKTMLCNIGILYRNLEDSVNAYKAHQQAIQVTLKNSNPANLIYCYTKAIETYSHFNSIKRRRDALIRKYEVANAVVKKRGKIVKPKQSGDKIDKETDDLMSEVDALIDPSKAIIDDKACGNAAEEIAKEYQKDPKNIKLSEQYHLTAIQHFKKTEEEGLLADTYWSYAYHLDVFQKRSKEGIENYRKAVALYTHLKDTSSINTLLCNIGITYKELGDSVNSYKSFKQAIELTLHNSDPETLAYSYNLAAESYDHFNHYGKQKDVLLKELTIYEKLNNQVKVGSINKTIGKLYEEDYNDYTTADGYFKKSISSYNKTDDLDGRAHAYWEYAYNKKEKLNDYDEAIKSFETAYGLFLQNKDTSNASVMRSNVAQTYWSIEDFEKAIQNHKLAIDLATKGKNQEMIAKSWNALADLYKKTDNPVKSKEALTNAITALEVMKDSVQLATAYANIASSYSKSQDYAKSFEFYGKAATIRKNLKDTASWALVLYDWGNVYYYDKKEYAPASEKFNASLKLYRKIKDKSNEVFCLISLAAIEQANNDYKKAEPLYNQALTLAKSLNNEIILAFCYNQMKDLYRNTGRSALADENSLKALEMYKKLGYWTQVASSLSGIAYDYYYVYGDLAKAINYYDQAQVIADTLSDKIVLAGIVEGRATLYSESGEFSKALETIDKSYELYKSLYNEWGIAGTYIDRGNVYKSISEYETSMKYQNKADSIYLKLGTEYARLAPLANIGETYASMGNYPKGLEYSMKAYQIMKNAGDMNANLCIIGCNIGDIYFNMNNFAEADKWLKDALEISRKVGAKRPRLDILNELGRVKIEEKKYGEAQVYLDEGRKLAIETGIKVGYLSNLILIGKLQVEQKQNDKAGLSLDEALKLATSIGKETSLWETLYLQGLLNKNTNNLAKSKEYLKESVRIIEKIRNKVTGGEEAQKLFSSDKNILKVYDALVEVLLALGETEEAMTYIQKNNDDNLKAKFKGLDMKFESESKNKAVTTEREMKAKLDGIEEQIQKEKALHLEKQNSEKLKTLEGVKTIAESEYLKFVNQQINVQPELSKFFNNSVQPTQFRKIKGKIPKDMALLSYLAGENQLYIFAATSDTVVAKIVNVSRAQLTKDINAMLNIIRTNMGNFQPVDLKNELAERQELVTTMKQTDPMIKPFEDAYHYLVAPVSKEIAGKSRLGVIPTGALNYIPFQMLGKTLENGKFSLMMNQFAIFYCNSTDMLFREESDVVKNYNILAFGNPDKSLPSTEKEVNDIKRMFPSASVYLREEATEDRAKYADEKYNVMHFATHGNLDYEDFSQSFLTMAGNPSKSEDGKLTLEELWGMDVMTHLNIVVLSACQTAVTKGSSESSAVSPASGFLQNGVKSVVATLWKVDDEATSLLISDFYNNLKTMDAVDALRAAQIKLSTNKKFSHPYYWAAVVLLGDWR